MWPPRGDDGAGGVLAESKQGRGSSLRLGLRHSGGAGEGASPVRTSLYIFSLETLSPPLRWLPGLAPAPASRRSANPGGGPRCSGPGGGGAPGREGGGSRPVHPSQGAECSAPGTGWGSFLGTRLGPGSTRPVQRPGGTEATAQPLLTPAGALGYPLPSSPQLYPLGKEGPLIPPNPSGARSVRPV